MRARVAVWFDDDHPEMILDVDDAASWSSEDARRWLDEQFVQMECEPLRPTGKVLLVDKVLAVARAAGPQRFTHAAWAQAFGHAVAAALARPDVRVNVEQLAITY